MAQVMNPKILKFLRQHYDVKTFIEKSRNGYPPIEVKLVQDQLISKCPKCNWIALLLLCETQMVCCKNCYFSGDIFTFSATRKNISIEDAYIDIMEKYIAEENKIDLGST